jgi:acetoin utilization protein AcuB
MLSANKKVMVLSFNHNQREDHGMLVKNWMSKPAITVTGDAMLVDAISLLQKHEIRSLPVMDGALLVGIVTERDFKNASTPDSTSPTSYNGEPHLIQKAVCDIMTMNPITIFDNQTIEDAAELFLVHKISGLPVENQAREVVGIITKSDLFRFILTAIGMGKDSIQFSVELIDRPGCIKEVTDIMRDYGGRIGTIFSTRERAGEGHRQAYFRLYNIDRPSLSRLKEELKEKVKLQYIINHREKMSEIF